MHTGISINIGRLEWAPEEMCEELREIKVELDGPDVSDVILLAKEGGNYYCENLMTGKKGKDYKEVMREDRRFIIVRHYLEDSLITLNYPRGCYFKYIEKYDLVMIVFCSLKRQKNDNYKWVEFDNDYFPRLFISNDYRFNNYSYDNIETVIDICGQASIDYDNFENTMERLTGGYYVNVPTGIQNVLIDYYKGCVSFVSYKMKVVNNVGFSFQTIEEIRLFVKSFIEACLRGTIENFESGINLLAGENTFPPLILPDVPDKAMQRMKDVMRIVMFRMTSLQCTSKIKMKSICFSCLQNIDGTIYLRLFVPIMNLHNTWEKTEVNMVEFERIVINEQLFTNPRIDANLGDSGILVWCDDNLEGTPFEFTAEPLRNYIRNLDIHIEDNVRIFTSYINFLALSSRDEYYVCSNSLVKFAYELGTCKPFERLYKSIKDNWQKTAVANVVASFSAENFLENFAPIDETQKSLTKMLGISSEILEQFSTCRIDWKTIRFIKKIFSTEEAAKYLVSMNKEDSRLLLKYIHELPYDYFNSSEWKYNPVKLLISMYGCRNWKNYFNFILTKLCRKERDIYYDYIRMVSNLKLESQFSEWKLTGDALLKSYKSLIIVDYSVNGEDSEYFAEQFKEKEKYWKLREYEDNEFFITYPKSPTDLIIEGIYLKHCAKEFVENVANGNTEIYFIRRKSSPDVPFYTMEICGDTIRQCHGLRNCNISKNRDVAVFIERFAKESNLSFNEAEAGLLLGPNLDDEDPF